MPGNVDPIYTKVPNQSNNLTTAMNQPITAAANDYTGVSGNNSLVWTAGANGGYIEKLRFKAAGSNVATVARIYINNGSTPGTAANNTLIGEMGLPITAAIATAQVPDFDYPLNMAMDPNFRLYVGLGTAVSGGWFVTPFAGQY